LGADGLAAGCAGRRWPGGERGACHRRRLGRPGARPARAVLIARFAAGPFMALFLGPTTGTCSGSQPLNADLALATVATGSARAGAQGGRPSSRRTGLARTRPPEAWAAVQTRRAVPSTRSVAIGYDSVRTRGRGPAGGRTGPRGCAVCWRIGEASCLLPGVIVERAGPGPVGAGTARAARIRSPRITPTMWVSRTSGRWVGGSWRRARCWRRGRR
jgi:hypothetical protein